MDDDIRGFDLGPAGVGNVGYHQGCILTGGGFVALVESFHFFFFDTAFLEETFHFWFGENSGFRRILLCFNPFVQFFVDIHDGIVSTVLAQSFFYKGIKRIPLASGRQRCIAAKQFIYESTAELFCVLGVVEKSVDICTAVIKYREQESKIRHFYDPVTDAVLDIVGFCIVAETCFGKVYRADAAQNMIIDLIGSIKHFLTIRRFTRDIVYSVDQDDIIILTVIVRFDHFVIEFIQDSIIL